MTTKTHITHAGTKLATPQLTAGLVCRSNICSKTLSCRRGMQALPAPMADTHCTCWHKAVTSSLPNSSTNTATPLTPGS